MKKYIQQGKHLFVLLFLVLLFIGQTVNAEVLSSQEKRYDDLYYTAKVWGYYKYFHDKLADGDINWDQKLLDMLDDLESAKTRFDFDDMIIEMMNEAGLVDHPNINNPNPFLDVNLNTSWFDNDHFSEKVTGMLRTVKNSFEGQLNSFYVTHTMNYPYSPTFKNDTRYNNVFGTICPPEKLRLLALFRFWNIINYFYPHGDNVTNNDWDLTLERFIPKFINATNKKAYDLAVMELVKSVDDNGIRIEGRYADQIYGAHYLPLELKQIGDETVITRKLIKKCPFNVGDVIKSINGTDIATFRERLLTTTVGGNESVIDRNINRRIIRGNPETVDMVIQYEVGDKSRKVSIVRNMEAEEYHERIQNNGPVWEVRNYQIDKSFGYVDLERLKDSDIGVMFNDLKETRALVLDVRSVPAVKINLMVGRLFSTPQRNVDVIYADPVYPGFLEKAEITAGFGNINNPYDRKVFILVDEETEGIGELAAMTYGKRRLTKIIGTHTAGDVDYIRERGPQDKSEPLTTLINLPGNVQIRYTPYCVVYPDGTPTHRVGIVPDYYVKMNTEDIRLGKDTALLKAISMIGAKDAEMAAVGSDQSRLFNNYPNPFNPITYINYELQSENSVNISVFNTSGQQVWQSGTKQQQPGMHKIMFDGSKMNSGIYIYRLNIDGKEVDSRKMMLIK